MYKLSKFLFSVFLSVGMCSTAVIAADKSALPSPEEMWQIIQRQQQAIERLEQKLENSESALQETAIRIESNANSLSQTRSQVGEARQQLDMAADAIDNLALVEQPGVDIGGYGELHYNNLDSGSEIDLHRFVLFFGHSFSEKLRFFSELEVEHSIAGEGKVGEVELEQAFVQWDYSQSHNAKAGVFLVPVGIMNETHEPETFYGVERNPVEKNVIPATWWEGGVALGGELSPGWSYDLALHSGLSLDTDNSSSSKRVSVRSGRQKVGKAAAENFAYTGRLRYTGTPGLSWGLTLQYQDDVTQNDANNVGVSGIDGLLVETDVVYQRGDFSMRGLYAQWSFDDGINSLSMGADKQQGWYVEPAYKISPKLGMFARYARYDLTAGAGSDSEKNQLNFGLNFWLDQRFVMKLDIQRQDNDKGGEDDGFNLGIGYSF